MNEGGYTEFFSVGCDYKGQLGHGQQQNLHDRRKFVQVPKSLSFDILISQISCGASHTLMLTKKGELFAMGCNKIGQLGLGDRTLEFSTAPLLVQEVENMKLKVTQIASGAYHNLMLSAEGFLYSWGSNSSGQCAQSVNNYSEVFMPIRIFSNQTQHHRRVVQIDCGDNFSGYLTEDGNAYTFGDNTEGQLGIGDKRCLHSDTPTQVLISYNIQVE